jgi:DNA modification methylase
MAVEAYSEPGDLVVDPMCGIGTTLVEAADLGRRVAGVELEPRWSKLAAANLDRVYGEGETRSLAEVIEGDARQLPRLLTTRAQHLLSHEPASGRRRGKLVRMAYGQADLILTSPPYACSVADVCAKVGDVSEPLRRDDTTNYSPDRRNLGHARGDAYLAAMAEIYQVCAATLKPGGFLVLVTKDMRAGGALRNLSGETVALCQSLGLLYWQHVISLLATIRDDELVMRPSFWQTLHVRRARAQGERTHVVAHEDVLVFRKPKPATAAQDAPASKAA